MWVELGFCRQLGIFKKRDYKYFEYKKVIFVWYYNSESANSQA